MMLRLGAVPRRSYLEILNIFTQLLADGSALLLRVFLLLVDVLVRLPHALLLFVVLLLANSIVLFLLPVKIISWFTGACFIV